MFKYLIQAYNDTQLGAVNEIRIRVVAPNEDAAIERAKQIQVRSHYSVLEIEDLRGAELKKAELQTIDPIELPGVELPGSRRS